MNCSTASNQLNESLTQEFLHESSGVSQVLHASSQSLHHKHKHVKQSAAVLQSIGKRKLDFEFFHNRTEDSTHPSG